MGHQHLHGIVAPGTRLDADLPRHRLLDCGPCAALISDFPPSEALADLPPETLADLAMAHHAILTAYCDRGGVLPMRFGAVFSDEDAIRAELTTRHEGWRAAFDAARQLREYALRIAILPDGETAVPPPAADSGRNHLQARRAKRDARATRAEDRARFARSILSRLEPLSVQIDPAGAPKPDRLLDCVVLLAADQVPALKECTAACAAEARALNLQLQIRGPWPPYSFDATTLSGQGGRHGG